MNEEWSEGGREGKRVIYRCEKLTICSTQGSKKLGNEVCMLELERRQAANQKLGIEHYNHIYVTARFETVSPI